MTSSDSQKFWPWRGPELVEKSEGGLFDVRYKDTIYRVILSLSHREFWIFDKKQWSVVDRARQEILFRKFLENKKIRKLVTKESI